MFKSLLAATTCFVLVASCNNSGEKKEEKSVAIADSGGHDMHNMPMDNSAVPPVPAVPEGGKVFFKNLKNDQTITLPFKMEMGAEVMKVDTANGPIAAGAGHHHLFINAEDSLATGTVIPKDSAHIHFGKGQSEYELKDLAPGKYKFTLQMADAIHRSYGGRLSATIMVNVKKQ